MVGWRVAGVVPDRLFLQDGSLIGISVKALRQLGFQSHESGSAGLVCVGKMAIGRGSYYAEAHA